MSRGWSYIPGDWWAICDSCGRKFKASELRKRWDGFMVCKDDLELRHPQDFVKTKQDKITVPWARVQQEAVFIQPSYYGIAVAGVAIAGQVVSGSVIGTLK